MPNGTSISVGLRPYGHTRSLQRMLNTRPASICQAFAHNAKTGNVELDLSGNGFDGAYNGNQDLRAVSGPDGGRVTGFDGTAYNRIYSPEFNAGFNGAEGTWSTWVRAPNQAFWEDEIAKYIGVIKVDGNNYIYLRKEPALENGVGCWYTAGGAVLGFIALQTAPLDWFNITASWSATEDEFDGYFNGQKIDPTQDSLGVWAGDLFSDTTVIGCGYTVGVSEPWIGWIGGSVLWTEKLTDAEVSALA